MAGPAFDQREGHIWYNGEYVDWKNAKVHVLTHGLHYGSCVFEGVRAYGGEIFKLEEHTDRLFKSAEALGFELPYTQDALMRVQIDILAKEGLTDAYLRPVAWRGSEMMGISAQSNTINVAVAAWEWPSYFSPEARLQGLRLATAEWRRPDPRTIPCKAKASGLYMICTLSKHKAEQAGYNDAMMLDFEGYVAEATGANIFFAKNGVLHTPMPDCFLNGLTRQTVVDLARRRGIEVIERKIRPEELGDFEECFLTGTAVEVTPVSQIDNYAFTPGDVTKTLMDDYTSEVLPKAAAAE
ncbi:branched-chain amino acid aminotransferase [Cohaesibacter celericrescens]|uniref:Branched-chain-amino-acid aminotransferase n=1 Tax=Cohaesibacter celericrescens TaxID=2067669 RepID=A0A2N5XXH0_9HYPH|nr:branched-chain amino acid aminotransferase [Cohaesibacter celericrescens]PLW79145.1 branched-chain amino acid aminotransferase [Cohaesibacter celericrescens]